MIFVANFFKMKNKTSFYKFWEILSFFIVFYLYLLVLFVFY